MTEENTSQSVDLNEETRTIWDQNAAFWDENMGDGNDFQRLLVTEQGFSYRLMVFNPQMWYSQRMEVLSRAFQSRVLLNLMHFSRRNSCLNYASVIGRRSRRFSASSFPT